MSVSVMGVPPFIWPAQPTITDPKRLDITIKAVMGDLGSTFTGRAAMGAKRLLARTPGADFCTRGLILVGPSGIIPVDQLEECAVFATALLHLIEQRQFVAVKSAEPLIPAKVLQLVFTGAAWESSAAHPVNLSLVPRTTAGEPSWSSTHWRISS